MRRNLTAPCTRGFVETDVQLVLRSRARTGDLRSREANFAVLELMPLWTPAPRLSMATSRRNLRVRQCSEPASHAAARLLPPTGRLINRPSTIIPSPASLKHLTRPTSTWSIAKLLRQEWENQECRSFRQRSATASLRPPGKGSGSCRFRDIALCEHGFLSRDCS